MEEQRKQKKQRCPVCRKKLGMMVFTCKCEVRFCIEHSHPEAHECTYDHKTHGRNELKKTLIEVKPDKVIPI